MSDWFIIPAKVILFVLSDSFLVPTGIILILTVSITLVVRLILKIKKEGWNWKSVNAEDASFDTWRSSPSYHSFDNDSFRSTFTDPLYRNVLGNVYNSDN